MGEQKELLLEYNLQFFAEDGEGGEKTEPATAKKLRDARDEGKVAKSQELTAALGLLTLFILLKLFIPLTGQNFVEVFNSIYGRIPEVVRSNGGGMTLKTYNFIFVDVLLKIIIICLPFFLGGAAMAFVSNVIQVGWKVTSKPMEPKFSKMNPVNGFKRIFSKDSLFNLLKSIIKIVFIFYVAYVSIKDNANDLFILYEIGLMQAVGLIGDIIISTGLKISVVYLLIGVIDYVYQRRKFANDMKMTKQEVKDEYKNTEGDPQIKGQQRRRMQEASQRRMMKSVPQADVVITNPTHIAVAVKYDNENDIAPRVTAKGEDFLAQKIKDVAREANVPIVENKPLARMLYTTVDIDQQIPPELYQAVAEILATVYTSR